MPDHSPPAGNKSRLLFLLDYLWNHTDDDHVITTAELLDLYHENGFKCSRLTINDDVRQLRSAGIDVVSHYVARNGTKTNGYHLGPRLFELAELRMLADAVSSSRFITAEKSDLLVSKLSRLTNEQNRDTLRTQLHNADRLKTTNPNVFVSMDVIRQGIDQSRKIAFHIWDYTPEKQRVPRNEGELYVASPYALIWNDDRYYCAAWSDKRQKIIKYRVDRMYDVTLLDDPAVVDETFNAAHYARTVIKMFDGDQEETQVTLLCENPMMTHILDRFGEETGTEVVDANHFRAIVSVVPSTTFFGWVFQYRGCIVIDGPEDIRQQYETMLSQTMERQIT